MEGSQINQQILKDHNDHNDQTLESLEHKKEKVKDLGKRHLKEV